jgi:hypothetical protein
MITIVGLNHRGSVSERLSLLRSGPSITLIFRFGNNSGHCLYIISPHNAQGVLLILTNHLSAIAALVGCVSNASPKHLILTNHLSAIANFVGYFSNAPPDTNNPSQSISKQLLLRSASDP